MKIVRRILKKDKFKTIKQKKWINKFIIIKTIKNVFKNIMKFNIIIILKDLIKINIRFDRFLFKFILIILNNEVFNFKIIIEYHLILF